LLSDSVKSSKKKKACLRKSQGLPWPVGRKRDDKETAAKEVKKKENPAPTGTWRHKRKPKFILVKGHAARKKHQAYGERNLIAKPNAGRRSRLGRKILLWRRLLSFRGRFPCAGKRHFWSAKKVCSPGSEQGGYRQAITLAGGWRRRRGPSKKKFRNCAESPDCLDHRNRRTKMVQATTLKKHKKFLPVSRKKIASTHPEWHGNAHKKKPRRLRVEKLQKKKPLFRNQRQKRRRRRCRKGRRRLSRRPTV